MYPSPLRIAPTPCISFGVPALKSLGTLVALLSASWLARAQLPAGWADQDIGAPSFAGSAAFANGNWTVSGGGSDIWNASDNFHFAFESSTDNAQAVARVTSVQNTDPWAKAGIMFRDSNDPSSTFAMVVVTPGNGVNFQWRNSYAGQCGYYQVGGAAPMWVRLVRAVNSFSGSYSTDGATWIAIGATQTIPMNSIPVAGLAVTAHNDGLLCAATFDNVTISNIPPPAPPVFGAYRELWPNLNSTPGNTLDALTNTAWNPNWPDFPDPSYTQVFTNFETEVNSGMNQYGQLLRTLVVPPASGNYSFWIASDDSSELFLSTDEDPANMVSIASVPGWTNSREWTKYPEQQSAPVTLAAGRRYYLEAIMQQGSGGDNLAVRWQLPNFNFEEPLTASSAAGTKLVPFTGVDDPPGIYQQTTNLTVIEGRNATFTVLVTNQSSVSYQWYLNNGPISDPSSLQPDYTVTNVSLAINNGQVYSCAVANGFGTVFSTPVTLNVLADTVPPTVQRTLNVGLTNVQIVYSKRVAVASATNLANYAFSNGLGILSATLSQDAQTVTLTTAPLAYGSNYVVLINGVHDLASTPNTIAPNTPAALRRCHIPQPISAIPQLRPRFLSPPTRA